MPKSPAYLDVTRFAQVACLSQRGARAVLAKCLRGADWRGHQLKVCQVPAKGGPGGERYEVRADSLPPELQAKLVTKTVPAVATRPRRDQPVHIEGEFDWKVRHDIIAPILDTPPGSARAAAVRDAADRKYLTSAGIVTISRATIRRWLTACETKGVGGLARKARADRRQQRVLISREWDKLSLPPAVQEQIATELVTFVRSLWANPTLFAGWNMTAMHGAIKLRELTADALGVPVASVPKEACMLTRPFVEREKHYRIVGAYERDRKAHEDRTRPRVQRSIDGLQPMEIVMGDVHPLDIYYQRDDGSLATAKLIAFADVATGRVRFRPAFFEKGNGVRQAHVIQVFIDMVIDPLWGLPSRLYLDNGSEYQWDSFIEDALALTGMTISIDGNAADKPGGTIRAQPYNAASKGLLEGAFRQLETRFFSHLDGWISGDRTRAKSSNVGKSPVQYGRTRADLVRDIQNVETAFNSTTQLQGRLDGKSPIARFNELVKAGWKRTDMDEGSLFSAFCLREARTVTQGAISYKGRKFYHDSLAAMPAGSTVIIGIPKWRTPDRLALWDERENLLGIVDPDRRYAHDDQAGAVEASRRQKVTRDAIRRRKSQTIRVDGSELLARLAEQATPAEMPERGAVVTFDPNKAAAGAELAKPAKVRIKEQRQRELEAGEHQASVLRRLVMAGGS